MSRLRLKAPEPLEAQVQRAVLTALRMHPKVAHANRMNSGVFKPVRKDGSTGFVRAGFEGCPDVVGMLKGGRALYVECKRPSGKVTPAQDAFLDKAKQAGALAFVARSADDVYAQLRDADAGLALELPVRGEVT